MKIGFFEIRTDEERLLKFQLSKHSLLFSKEIISEKNIEKYKDIDILSTHSDSKVTEDIINGLPKLKLIATRTTGFDHIDLKTAKEKNIVVCTVPSYGEDTVAEYAFALLLALSRKIIPAYNRIHTQRLCTTENLQGFDLKGKTIGIIGTGKIGIHAIKIALGFGMNVLAYDVYEKLDLAKDLGFKYVSLDELLENSDIISLHVPYFPSTHYLINKENIKKVKKGAVIINTARGKVVDTEAVLLGLEQGYLAGAGLDVFEEEAQLKNDRCIPLNSTIDKIIKMENVIVTPHNAFNSKEAEERIVQTTVENIQAFKKGTPQNQVK